MKQIKLENSDKVALVDDEDYEFLNRLKWYYDSYYPRAKIQGRMICMHSLLINKLDDEDIIDHIDRDPLNNKKNNFRLVTHILNSMNKGPQSNNTSGFKGVHKCKRDGKYKMSIKNPYGGYIIKHFKTAREAALEYDKCARRYYGEHAYLNFPGAL